MIHTISFNSILSDKIDWAFQINTPVYLILFRLSIMEEQTNISLTDKTKSLGLRIETETEINVKNFETYLFRIFRSLAADDSIANKPLSEMNDEEGTYLSNRWIEEHARFYKMHEFPDGFAKSGARKSQPNETSPIVEDSAYSSNTSSSTSRSRTLHSQDSTRSTSESDTHSSTTSSSNPSSSSNKSQPKSPSSNPVQSPQHNTGKQSESASKPRSKPGTTSTSKASSLSATSSRDTSSTWQSADFKSEAIQNLQNKLNAFENACNATLPEGDRTKKTFWKLREEFAKPLHDFLIKTNDQTYSSELKASGVKGGVLVSDIQRALKTWAFKILHE